MKTLQKLVRNGNSTQVSIPRPILCHLGWLTGSFVVVELLEGEQLLIRKPQPEEIAPPRQRPIVLMLPVESAR